jgi:outer membrane protein assembly factor BamB
MPVTIIDLGELRGDVTPDPPARRPRPAGRPLRSLLVLAVALLTLAGAAPASERVAVTVPAGPAAAAFVTGDRVYVVHPPDQRRGEAGRFVAYRVDGAGRARVRWRTPLPIDGVARAVWERDGVVLLVARTADDSGWETVALDAGSGRVGWRQSGMAVPVGDGVLFQATGENGEAPTRGVDPSTGRTLWTVAGAPDLLQLSLGPAGVGRLVRMSPSGAVEVYDAASGVRLAARPLRLDPLPDGPGITLAAGLLLVTRADGDTVTGYDLDTLDPRWTASLPLLGYAESCGHLLCLMRQNGGMRVLDPATGVTRWTDDRWAAALGAAGGRLLVARETAAGSRLAVVEEATGRLVGDLGGWALVPQVEDDGPLIGVRPGPDGRLLLAAELDLAAARARVRDAIPGATGDCRASTALLVCRRADGIGLRRLGPDR